MTTATDEVALRGVARAGFAMARRMGARLLLALAALCVGVPAFAQTASIASTIPATLNQSNLRNITIRVDLSSGTTYNATGVTTSHFTLNTTISGLTVDGLWVNGTRTRAELYVRWDGSDFNAAATISVTVAAAATSHSAALTTGTVAVGMARWVITSTKTVALTEGGGTGSYNVSLESPPTGNVTVTVTSDHDAVTVDTDATPLTRTLTFTTGNWSTAQAVTLTPANDNSDTVDEVALVTNVATGGGYASSTAANRTVRVTVADDDTRTGTDYDTDDDGLIEIWSLAQLDAVRHDLQGDGSTYSGYVAAFPNAAAQYGCPDTSDSNQTGNCTGYELMTHLDFDTDGDGSTHSGGTGDTGDAYSSGAGWNGIGGGSIPAENLASVRYQGTFRGNGHVLRNFFQNGGGSRNGLFRQTFAGARIEGVGLDNAYSLNTGDFSGLLVGHSSGKVVACWASGTMWGVDKGVIGILWDDTGSGVWASYSDARLPQNNTGMIYRTRGSVPIIHSYATQTRLNSGTVSGTPRITVSFYDSTRFTGSTSYGSGQSTTALRSPTGYSSIYRAWDTHDINEDGRIDSEDDAWDFGTSSQYPVLKWGGWVPGVQPGRTATDTAPDFGSATVSAKQYDPNVAITSFQVPAATGGNGAIRYTASGLPAGLKLDSSGVDVNGCPGTEVREICGTPTTTTTGAVTVTITATDWDTNTMATDRDTLTFDVTVQGDTAPDFGSATVTAKSFLTGGSITEFQVPAATGGNGTLTYIATGLPTGARFDATGTETPGCPGTEPREVCGTPTTAGTGTATITVTDADTNTMATDRDTLQFTWTVSAADTAPSFGSGSVTNKTYLANVAITDFVVPAATGGNGAITYIASGLPTGLVFDATGTDTNGCTGTEAREICGTPTVAGGPVTVTITARDADSNMAGSDADTLTFTITVTANSAPDFGSGSVAAQSYITNSAITAFQVPAATGGNGTINYAASGLPTGVVFDATGTDMNGCTGTQARRVCGTPTTAGSGTATITATDTDSDTSANDRDTLQFTWNVAADSAPSFGAGSVSNKSYDVGLTVSEFVVPAASGGNGALTYIASGLPSGLVFDATGTDSPGCPGTEAREVCGTPTTAGAAVTVTITVTDADVNIQSTDADTLTFTVTVAADAAPDFGSGSVSNKSYATNLAITDFVVPGATGGNGALTYVAGGLPDGLVFDATGTDTPGCTGTEAREVCGTPTTATAGATVTITVTDADNNNAANDRDTLTFTITVAANSAPTFGSGSIPEKAFITSAAITAFQAPAATGGNGTITYAATGLPTGVVFDATGTDMNGCTGTVARQFCGTPTTAGSGTATITASDTDTDNTANDRDTLQFPWSVAADSAPSFGMGAVTAKTFAAGAAITEFVVPAATGGNGTIQYAASGLPAGLRFDETGSDSPGCPGSEAREVCGTPTEATSGAVTVTITATDLDGNVQSSDGASLTFMVTVTAGASLASSPGTLTEGNLGGARLTVTLIGVTFASGVDASSFELLTSPTIAGLSIGGLTGGASGSTMATLRLAAGAGYGFSAASTVSVRVPAAAHSGSDILTTGTLAVTPDPPSVRASRRDLTLEEDPGTDDANQGTYSLVLSDAPAGCPAGVVVMVASGVPDVTVAPDALTFLPADWGTAQTVTVTAAQDDDSDADFVALRHTVTTACAAAGYPLTLSIPSVRVTVVDDDAPPPPNEPPVATGTLDDVDVAFGGSARVSIAGLFTDEEPEQLTYAVSSSHPAVVSARLAWPAVELEGVGHGASTITVTAADPAGLSASVGFVARSGVTVAFAADASAPEGGAVRLTLTASRAAPEALAVPYVLAAGDGSASADESDHGGGAGGTAMFAAGATRAEISVPVLDDDEVEPVRERFLATLAEPAEDAGYGLGVKSQAVATIEEGVCDRGAAVRDELRRGRPCESVEDLSRWTSLRLMDVGMGQLRGEDFMGLSNLLLLDASGNRLTEFPAAALAALPKLWTLRLGGNRIAALPAGLGHPALRLLDLSGNRLGSLPADAMWGFAGLRRLHLSGNALADLPGGAFAGLGSLRALRLDGNRLAALPAGLFAGLGQLEELHLQDNPGAPFTLAVELTRTDAAPWEPGPAQVAAHVGAGAPFTLRASLAAADGPAAGEVSVPAGATLGAPAEVADGGTPLTLTARPEPVPDNGCEQGLVDVPCFAGFATVAGAPLTLYKQQPQADALPEQSLDSDSLRIPLAEHFDAAPDDALTYMAESSDPSVASVRIEDDTLVVEAEGDGVAAVTVTATDAFGQTGTLTFTVRATLPMRGGLRGWRLILVDAPPRD